MVFGCAILKAPTQANAHAAAEQDGTQSGTEINRPPGFATASRRNGQAQEGQDTQGVADAEEVQEPFIGLGERQPDNFTE